MGTTFALSSAKTVVSRRRGALRKLREQVDTLIGVRCACCAGEVRAGAVRSRGSLFCSIECALAAAVPGLYLG
jgi:hypothetical protein